MSLVVTLISNPVDAVVTTGLAEEVGGAIGATGIDWLADNIACDLIVPGSPAGKPVETIVREVIVGRNVDAVVQQPEGRRKKILIADMDSTMIGQECIDELAAEAGFGEAVAAVTARAMNGEIAFEPALRERVSLLSGLPVSVISKVLKTRISLAPGGPELVRTMRRNGGYTALVSGGFTAFTGPIADRIGFDEHRANVLLENADVLTGEVAEPILGQSAKVDALEAIASRLRLRADDVIAVGDGANDLAMIGHAGTGVALHAKPAVAAKAEIRIDHGDLTALLYLQGYKLSEFVS